MRRMPVEGIALIERAFGDEVQVIRHRTYCDLNTPGVDGTRDCTCGAERRKQIGPRKRRPPSLLSHVIRLESALSATLEDMKQEATSSVVAGINSAPSVLAYALTLVSQIDEFRKNIVAATQQTELFTGGNK